MLQLLIAEYWADWVGIELNWDKRELPHSSTRHLGFRVDLNKKMVTITAKHKNRILKGFDHLLMVFRKKGRLLLKTVQRIMGLQIWISTIFRVTRQFLTSTCDLLKAAGTGPYIHTRQVQSIIPRVVFDLKFWRRFVLSEPSAPFNSILGELPKSGHMLSSDAATSWGMAGVLRFDESDAPISEFQGLFWQISWVEWHKLFPLSALAPGSVHINVAEYLAILITCETFMPWCVGKLTELQTDNVTAKA